MSGCQGAFTGYKTGGVTSAGVTTGRTPLVLMDLPQEVLMPSFIGAIPIEDTSDGAVALEAGTSRP